MKAIRNFISNTIKLIQIKLGILFGLAGFWIAYSKFAIDHNETLPRAIEASHALIPTRGGKVSYYYDDSGAGRPIVLVHSVNAAASAFEMRPLFNFYAGKRPVYALDLPGYGFSARDKRPYSPQLFADSLYDFLDQVLDEPADVVALSLGCEFVARTALMHPEVINSIGMLSPSGFAFKRREVPAETLRNAQRLHAIMAFPLWSKAFYDLVATRVSIQWFLKKSFVGEPPQEFIDYGYVVSHQPGAEHVPLYFVSGMLFTPDARVVLYERLEVPVLVIYDEDAYVSFDTLDRHVHENGNWQAKRIAPTLGLPQWESLAETTAALDAFWEQE